MCSKGKSWGSRNGGSTQQSETKINVKYLKKQQKKTVTLADYGGQTTELAMLSLFVFSTAQNSSLTEVHTDLCKLLCISLRSGTQ